MGAVASGAEASEPRMISEGETGNPVSDAPVEDEEAREPVAVEARKWKAPLQSNGMRAPTMLRLTLPQDEPSVRVLLRKQSITPAHVERIVYN